MYPLLAGKTIRLEERHKLLQKLEVVKSTDTFSKGQDVLFPVDIQVSSVLVVPILKRILVTNVCLHAKRVHLMI